MKLSGIVATLVCLSAGLSSNLAVAAPDYRNELYEGSPCTMEDGSEGICVELPQCPMRIQEVKEGRRFSTSRGRCSFKNFVEIVCCPRNDPIGASSTPSTTSTTTTAVISNDLSGQLNRRPADVACSEYENEITGEDGQKINPNIFNGERALTGEFPFMVALGYNSDKENASAIKYSCAGSLISIKHVLTAAHCVSNVNEDVPVEARLGSVDLDDTSDYVQRIPVSEVIAHPNYRRSLNYYDIAVVKLRRSATLSRNVMPICLQTIPIPNLGSLLNFVVSGWGSTSFENEGSNSLQKTPSIQLISQAECAVYYKNFSKLPNGVDDSMICMLDKNVSRRADACQGDSGGPLLLLDTVSSKVIGITSFGQSCGSSIPAIYTSVIYYLNWIEDMVWPNKKRL